LATLVENLLWLCGLAVMGFRRTHAAILIPAAKSQEGTMMNLAVQLFAWAALGADALPPALATAAEAFERAQIAGDRAELERLLAPDYVLHASDGGAETRGQLIDFWTADGFDPRPVAVRDPVARVWTDGAALGGLVTLAGSNGGQAFSVTIRFIDVWQLREGRWQVVMGQATRVP
jgi:hypothetical protein